MSARTKSKSIKNQQTSHKDTLGSQAACNDATPLLSPALQRACSRLQRGDYDGAADLLAAAGRDIQVRNALGVCLMRLGRVDKAVEVFRSFVLMPGTVLERPDVSNACKRNFATALLMKGFPSGAMSVLAEIREPGHPVTLRLNCAIRRWEGSLSWFRWLDWKLNGIEPPMCQVPLEFEPGEFDFDVQLPRPSRTVESGTSSVKLAV
jgi:hypothetical protein